MKTLIVTILMAVVCQISSASDPYIEKMKETLQQMDRCRTLEEYQETANTFEVIAMAENDKWHPYYYCALIYGLMSMQAGEAVIKDRYAEKAEAAIDTAIGINPDESELYVLKAFVYYAMIQADPMSRGMQYMGMAEQALAKAEQLNSDNPRIWFLRGQTVYHMPAEYGGGSQAALPILEKAKEKYDNEANKDELDPNWGQDEIERLLEEIAAAEE